MQSEKVAKVFDSWATSGRAQTMADGHVVGATRGFELLSIKADQDVLDIGCGLGYAVRWAAGVSPSVRALGVDVSATMIDKARALSVDLDNADFVCGTFPEVVSARQFHRIFSVEALYYVPDLAGVLRAVHESLRPGGRFVTVIDHYRENLACHDWSQMVGVPLVLWSIEQWCQQLHRIGFVDVSAEQIKHPCSNTTQTWQVEHGSLILSAHRAD